MGKAATSKMVLYSVLASCQPTSATKCARIFRAHHASDVISSCMLLGSPVMRLAVALQRCRPSI